uniref:Coenzyme Q biosynthesis protein 4 homolog n=1 Tax=Paramoeba aestuarina TaxID=180227 RepID=A0A7S4PJM2_9EUKA|mmetsp:Transcript_7535/g.11346  ORF Transcript_7535/g.11346 Transcript_7535/m.11346 type:complete len:291 (+) Transcript_7535:33-905(+)
MSSVKPSRIIPLSIVQRAILLGGSAIGTLIDPTRGDLLATLTETACPMPALRRMRRMMMQDRIGRTLLDTKPRVTDAMLEKWASTSHGKNPRTLTGAYVNYMKSYGYLPSGRADVRFLSKSTLLGSLGVHKKISDAEFDDYVFILQRYREVHDFLHALTGLDSSEYDEGLIKYFEWKQTQLPTTFLSVCGVGIREGIVGLLQEALNAFHNQSDEHSAKGSFWRGFHWMHRLTADFHVPQHSKPGPHNLYLNHMWEKDLDAGTSLVSLREQFGIGKHFQYEELFHEEERAA